MATSGSTDFKATRNDIIEAAYRKIGVGSRAETLSASLVADAAEALELLAKSWEAQGIHLWTYGDALLFLEVGEPRYALPGAQVSEDVTTTALSGGALSGATSITVDSITGIADADTIGVVQDDGAIHWTTVNGVPAGSTVTLTAALTADAADDSAVYAYTKTISRPLRLSAVRVEIGDQETPMERYARETYLNQPNKSTTGIPTQFYYDPQLTAGQLFIWPTPASVDYLVRFSYERPIQDFDAAGNNPYFPVEWTRALVWNLAAELAPEHGTSLQRQAMIESKAAVTLDSVLDFDREQADVQFQPVLR